MNKPDETPIGFSSIMRRTPIWGWVLVVNIMGLVITYLVIGDPAFAVLCCCGMGWVAWLFFWEVLRTKPSSH